MLDAALAFSTLCRSPFLAYEWGMEVAPTGGEVKMFEGWYQEFLSLAAPFESQGIR